MRTEAKNLTIQIDFDYSGWIQGNSWSSESDAVSNGWASGHILKTPFGFYIYRLSGTDYISLQPDTFPGISDNLTYASVPSTLARFRITMVFLKNKKIFTNPQNRIFLLLEVMQKWQFILMVFIPHRQVANTIFYLNKRWDTFLTNRT